MNGMIKRTWQRYETLEIREKKKHLRPIVRSLDNCFNVKMCVVINTDITLHVVLFCCILVLYENPPYHNLYCLMRKK